MRWHCPPDTGFEIRALAVWGRARYLSVTEAPHNTDFHTWMGKKHFCFFQTAETGNRTPNSGVKGSGANHYPRVPALFVFEIIINILVCSFWFIWIPMLWVYGQQKYFHSYSAGIDFSRQNLTSTDVRFWRLESIPALWVLRPSF